MALLKEKLICLDVQQQNFGEYNLLAAVVCIQFQSSTMCLCALCICIHNEVGVLWNIDETVGSVRTNLQLFPIRRYDHTFSIEFPGLRNWGLPLRPCVTHIEYLSSLETKQATRNEDCQTETKLKIPWKIYMSKMDAA